VVFIPKTASDELPLTQSAFVHETQFVQQALRALVSLIDDRFDAVQPHLHKGKGQNRGERLAHNPLSPARLEEFIAGLGPMKSFIEGVKPTRPKEHIVALARNAPLKVFMRLIPVLQLLDKGVRLFHRTMAFGARLLVRKEGEQGVRIISPDLPQDQALGLKTWKDEEHLLYGHA
jgi:hypothetical protein